MEEALLRYTKSDRDLEKFILKGKQHLRWSEDGKTLVTLNHFDFLHRLNLKYTFIKDDVKELLSFNEAKFHTMLRSLTDTPLANAKYLFTPLRADFVFQYVLKRRNILRLAFGLD